MKKNKILLVLLCSVTLLSVFCVNSLAFFPGAATGDKKLFGKTVAVTPDRLTFNDIQCGSQDLDHLDISIPFADYMGTGETVISTGEYITAPSFALSGYAQSTTQNLYICDISMTGDSTLSFDTIGISLYYNAKNISYNSKDALWSYLVNNMHTFFPCYLAVQSSACKAQLSADVTIYNGQEVIKTDTITTYSNVSTKLYDRLIKPWTVDVASFVNTSSAPNFYYTLVIDNLRLDVTALEGGAVQWDFCRLGVYQDHLDSLPEGLTFNSIAGQETIVKYDLNPLQFLFDTFEALFSCEIFMGVSVGNLLIVALAVPALAAVLKAFKGG